MKLLVILICLTLERYTALGEKLKRFAWFDAYLQRLQRWLPERYGRGWWQLCFIAPLLLIVGLIYYFATSLWNGLAGFVLSILVLWYCLGPDDIFQKLMQYFRGADTHDDTQQAQWLTDFLGHEPDQEAAVTHREVTRHIVTRSFDSFFHVIFWFILLGPVGAVLIRSITQMRPLSAVADTTYQWLAWVPVRMMGLLYALVGSFTPCFKCWLKYLNQGVSTNDSSLADCGLTALTLPTTGSQGAGVDENKQALALIDRTLLVLMVLLFVFTMGAWIY